jgi:outer membrane receptor protein involved in Fe transport
LDIFSQRTIEEFTNVYNYPDTTLNHRVESTADYVHNQINTQSYKVKGYLENIIQVSNQILLNVGGRFDYFDLNKQLTLSPRINLAYKTGMGIVIRGAWGHYYQTPIYRQIAYPSASDTNTQAQRAIHYIVGIDYDLMVDQATQHFWRFKVEGYKKIYDNLITANKTSDGLVNYSRKNDATGTASGIDMQIIYSNNHFYGWISYGYLFARQTLVHDTIGSSFPRYTDQRHTLAVTGELELGSDWSINSRIVYGSGYPYTPSIAIYNNTKRIWEWIPSNKPNSQYFPSYSRVDLRIAKDFTIFGAPTSVFLDASNIFNAKNIQAYRYRFNNNGYPNREDVELWPFIPTIGMSVRF